MTHESRREYIQLQSVANQGRYKVWVKDGEPFIPGRKGQVEPYSRDGLTLAAFTDRPRILRAMARLPFVTSHQIGQEEGSVLFPVAQFPEMAKFLGLRKKRPAPAKHVQAKGLSALERWHHLAQSKNPIKKTTKARQDTLRHGSMGHAQIYP